MTFKVGDKVRLVKNKVMAAQIGATGNICDISREYIHVKWDENELRNGQQDGEYEPTDFRLVESKIFKLKARLMKDEV